MDGHRLRWRSLEHGSSALFLVAGALLVAYAATNGLEAFAGMTMEQKGFEVAYVLGFLGLLALYPAVADGSPWLARVGAVAAALGAVAFSVLTVFNLGALVGILPEDPPAWSLFVLLAATGFVLGYLSFGVATLRAGIHSLTVGLLLLVPGIIIVLMFAHMAAGFASDETVFVISAGQAMAHLAIGTTLRTEAESADRNESEPVAETSASG